MLQRKSRSQVLSAIRSNIGLSPSYSKGQDPAACILICSRQLLYMAVQRLQLVSICNVSTFNNVWMCYEKGSRSKCFLLCRLLLSWSVGFVHPSVPEETVLVVWYQSDLLIYSSVGYVTDHIYTGEIIRAVQPHSCPKISEVTWAIFVKITWSHWERAFSCDQAALWMVFSVCLSHLFDYVPIIVLKWNCQELSPRTRVRSMQNVKVRDQRSRSQRSQPNITVSGL